MFSRVWSTKIAPSDPCPHLSSSPKLWNVIEVHRRNKVSFNPVSRQHQHKRENIHQQSHPLERHLKCCEASAFNCNNSWETDSTNSHLIQLAVIHSYYFTHALTSGYVTSMQLNCHQDEKHFGKKKKITTSNNAAMLNCLCNILVSISTPEPPYHISTGVHSSTIIACPSSMHTHTSSI